ncbi:hypothetical protein [uncultured Jatrophihabitans sp.]|uniref:hypothetical protein n=1 Tax=uncultured Jatrophihabitans sp. TaxID=1610747 RepID=UPI0035CAE38F
MATDKHDHVPADELSDDESAYGRDVTVYGTSAKDGPDDEPDGARGRGTEHGLKGKLKQGVNALTGRDLDTASTAEVETTGEAGAGGADGRG